MKYNLRSKKLASNLAVKRKSCAITDACAWRDRLYNPHLRNISEEQRPGRAAAQCGASLLLIFLLQRFQEGRVPSISLLLPQIWKSHFVTPLYLESNTAPLRRITSAQRYFNPNIWNFGDTLFYSR